MSNARTSGQPAAAALPGHAEWLLTDGAGGYACGAVDDLPRRRYHGFWIARPAGGTRRYAVVSGLDERIVDGDRVAYLAHVAWRDGARSVPMAAVSFVPRPLPAWTFRGDGFVLQRSVALVRATATAGPGCVVRWTNTGSRAVMLHVRPLLGCGDVDQLPPAIDGVDGTVHAQGASWGVRPNQALPMLWFTADGVAACVADAAWYRGFLYATDRDRGYDHVGDRWTPGRIELAIGPGQTATLAFSLHEPIDEPAAAFDAAAAAAARAAAEAAADAEPVRARLQLGADHFLYRAEGGRLGVLAGFPWFSEWGRDVFVSLPGLTLPRGRLDLCAAVLRSALPFLRRGLLPNVYGANASDSHYDSCDAALWFALAVQRYADAGGDRGFVRQELVPALAAIAAAYAEGTDLGIAVDAAGLLHAGRDDLNATWMDARTRSGPVTPRSGLPVEIQALWYSLLAFLAEHDEATFAERRDRCGKAFVQRFWLADGKYLADRWRDGVADPTVRPNMLVAAALPRAPWTAAQRRGVVSRATAELVVPVGLRTLSPLDSAYRGRYEGGIDARDTAYHQGTAWPWLAGFFVEASLRAAAKREKPQVAASLLEWLRGMAPELDRAGIDHLSEVYDGDPPHRPGGTFAQAWNTGELLRAFQLCAEAAK